MLLIGYDWKHAELPCLQTQAKRPQKWTQAEVEHFIPSSHVILHWEADVFSFGIDRVYPPGLMKNSGDIFFDLKPRHVLGCEVLLVSVFAHLGVHTSSCITLTSPPAWTQEAYRRHVTRTRTAVPAGGVDWHTKWNYNLSPSFGCGR